MAHSSPLVGILAPMTSELRPIVRAGHLVRAADRRAHTGTAGSGDPVRVVATLAGIGFASATASAERLLTDHRPDHVVVVGIAGGIAPDLSIGDVIVPDRVIDGVTGTEYHPAPLGALARAGTIVSFDGLSTDPEEVARLVAAGGLALDMESSAVAAVCERHRTPWSVVRSISDRVGIEPVDDDVLGLARPDGSPDLGAVARFVVSHPRRLPGLIRLGRYSTQAANAAAGAALAGCATVASPAP